MHPYDPATDLDFAAHVMRTANAACTCTRGRNQHGPYWNVDPNCPADGDREVQLAWLLRELGPRIYERGAEEAFIDSAKIIAAIVTVAGGQVSIPHKVLEAQNDYRNLLRIEEPHAWVYVVPTASGAA